MIVKSGLIAWLGSDQQLAKALNNENFVRHLVEEVDCTGQLLLPGFVECHTHLIFAGSRADEFEKRNLGMSYQEISKQGGGILSTMRATRKANESELVGLAQQRVNEFARQGVTTLEIKSGYGLDLKNEIKLLNSIEKLKGPDIVSTFLGPHARPPEFSSNTEYLDYIIESVLPQLKKKSLTSRADIFIEKLFFTAKESLNYLKKAKDLGFDLTIHANQLSDSGGAELAIRLGALSADHVIHLKPDTIRKFSKSKTVPVLLPMADLYMRCAYPPARSLIDAGCEVALATDFNPGTCPSQDIMLVGLLARLEMKMTLPEVFRAYTFGAAKALGLEKETGLIIPGHKANFILTYSDLTDFFYSAGKMPKHYSYKHGSKMNIYEKSYI